MIDSVQVDVEPAVESQLIDLGGVPLSILRELRGVLLDRSLQHVRRQSMYLKVSADGGGGGAERID